MSREAVVAVLFWAAVTCATVCLAGVVAGYVAFALPLLVNVVAAVAQYARLRALRGEQ